MLKLTNNSSLRRVLSVCCAAVSLSLAAVSVAQAQTSTVTGDKMTISPTDRKQQITMVGGDMERSQFALQSAKNIDEVIQWCFVDLPFDVCRVAYDKKQELVEGEKNYKFYDKAIKSMQMIKAANPEIEFWATMKSDYNGYQKENNMPDWICDARPTTWIDCEKYGIFLTDYLELMEKNGVRIDYLSTAKEWTQSVTAENARDIILVINKECEKRGITRPKYVDAASWSTAQGAQFMRDVAAAGSVDLYAGAATHNYGSNGKYEYEKFVDECNKYGLPPYAEESEYGAGGPNYGVDKENMSSELHAYRDKCEFYKDGIVGEVLFEVFSRGVDKESRAVYFPYNGTAHRMRTYYVMHRFVNSLVGGKYYIPSEFVGSDSVYTMAFTSDDEIFLCVVNDTKENRSGIELSIDGKVKCSKKAEYLTFDAALPRTGKSAQLAVSKKNVLTFDVSAESVTFINIPLK